MKIKGSQIAPPTSEKVYIARGDDVMVFEAAPVLSFEDFEKLYPEVEPPTAHYPDGRQVPDFTDERYLKALEARGEARINYMFLKSLEATPGLEWETVDLANPETYGNFRDELEASGLAPIERQQLLQAVITANGLDESRMEKARESFLALSQAQQK